MVLLVVVLWASSASRVHAGTNVWTSSGPGGGTILVLAIDPVTPTTLYAGTERNGVFKSTDGARSWSAANAGLPTSTSGIILALDPGTPTTLYAGTDGSGVFAITFQPLPLTVSQAGTGSGTVTSSPAGISCGTTCSAAFDFGTSVTLTATAARGSTFTGWSGEGCSGTGTCTVSLTQARSVTATFTLAPTGGGGGGCAINPGAGFDPLVGGMIGILLAYLVGQHRRTRWVGWSSRSMQRHNGR